MVFDMRMKSIGLFISFILLVTGCSTFVPILGSNRGWSDVSDIEVIEDFEVSRLRIRVTQDKKYKCVSGNRHTIEIDGPINKDTSFVLDRILNKLPDCRIQLGKLPHTVYLNSGGGTLEDGYAIGTMFRKHGVGTVVTGKQACASACAVAFLGGRFRVVETDGRLIFHAPYRHSSNLNNIGGIECLASNSKEAQELKAYYLQMIGAEGNRLFERTMDYCSEPVLNFVFEA